MDVAYLHRPVFYPRFRVHYYIPNFNIKIEQPDGNTYDLNSNFIWALVQIINGIMLPGKKGIVQQRKKAAEFGAESIDNTAPVKDILFDLQHGNSEALLFYCRTIRQQHVKQIQNLGLNGKRIDHHSTLTGHPLFAFSEEWDGGLHAGYFEPFTYKSMMPKMLTRLQNTVKEDPVSSFLKLKADWYRRGHMFSRIAASHPVTDKFKKISEDVAMGPKFLVDLATHLDSDPDPNFDATYNWYYTGNGNLQLINIGAEEYLLHSEFNILYLTLFSRPALEVNTNHTATYDCGEGNHILETIYGANNIVALRTKSKIFILKIVLDNEKVEIEHIKSIGSQQPYTGISFDNHHKNILYVTSLDNKVKIINLDRLKARTVQMLRAETLQDNWNTVIGSDRVTYTHVTKKGLGLYDKRTNYLTECSVNVLNLSDLRICNPVTAAFQQEGSTSMYCASNHHLFMFDLRHGVKTKPKAVLRWTHGMQCAPTYISICNFEFNKELVSLSSQWCEDTCVVPNYTSSCIKEGEIFGVTVPYRPPSILQTLREAKEKLLSFDLHNPIEERLVTAITGQIVLQRNETYAILTQNSFGDILCHVLYPEHMEVLEDNGIEHLDEWRQPFKIFKKPYEVTDLINISGKLKKLRKVPDDYRFQKDAKKVQDAETLRQQVVEYFEKEKLDPGLLDIWTDDRDGDTGNHTIPDENSSLAINLYYSDDSD